MSTHHTDWQCGETCADGRPCTVPLRDPRVLQHDEPHDSTPVDPVECPCDSCDEVAREQLAALRLSLLSLLAGCDVVLDPAATEADRAKLRALVDELRREV